MNHELLLCVHRLHALISQKHHRARKIDASSRKLITLITQLYPEPPLPNPLPVSKQDIDQDLEFLAAQIFKSKEISLDIESFKQDIKDEVKGAIWEEFRRSLREEMREIVREEIGAMSDKKRKEEIEEDVRKREEESERDLIESAIRGYQRTMMTTNWGSPTERTRW